MRQIACSTINKDLYSAKGEPISNSRCLPWSAKALIRRLYWSAPEDAASLVTKPVPSDQITPTVFIECTHTYHNDINTGIQRVVRNIIRHAEAVASDYGYAVVPVFVDGDRFIEADISIVLDDKSHKGEAGRAVVEQVKNSASVASPNIKINFRHRVRNALQPFWHFGLRLIVLLLPFDAVRRFVEAPQNRWGLRRLLFLPIHLARFRFARLALHDRDIDYGRRSAKDILLLLDSSWNTPPWSAVRRFKRQSGWVAGVIYDLVPVTHPHTVVPELIAAFASWLNDHLRVTDVFLCISASIARQLSGYLSTKMQSQAVPAICYFHLGTELDLVMPNDEVRPVVRDIFAVPRHVFVVVGTIEPRKNHSFILDAFDRFWADGGDASLVVIGQRAWKTDAFLDRVENHQKLDRQLYLLRDVTDTELDFAYRNASALVIASEIEGFGLPIVEAFQRGLPVLCSDIPVFREIAQGKASFFALDDPNNLTAALLAFCRAEAPSERRHRLPQAWPTWRESTEQLFAALMSEIHRETR